MNPSFMRHVSFELMHKNLKIQGSIQKFTQKCTLKVREEMRSTLNFFRSKLKITRVRNALPVKFYGANIIRTYEKDW